MALTIRSDAGVLQQDDYGSVRIGKSRVTLDSLVACFNRDESPEEIAQNFPTLELADIYTVKGYYLRHREEVDDYVLHGERKWAEFERAHPEMTGEALKEKLRESRKAKESS